MSARIFLTAICLILAPAVSAADITIMRVFTGWRQAASFKRISEFLDGKENTGGEAILRTHPEQRGGYYFLVRAANPGAPMTITANLEVITVADTKPASYTFPVELKAGQTVFHLGLTGADWVDAKANPVAWKLDLVDRDGRALATEKSYLWERPSGK
jgi:hypothetical protein